MAQTLATIVASAGSLMSVTAAIRLSWKKRAPWEPVEEDVPKLAQHLGGLFAGVAIVVTWYLGTIAGSLSADAVLSLIIKLAIATLIGAIAYSLLVGTLVYDRQVATGPRTVAIEKIIGGFWLSPGAKNALVAGVPRPSGVEDLVKGCEHLSQIWSRLSRALAKLSFQLAYILLTSCGTWLLACAAILLSGTPAAK
jgi:hypothetical protein